MRAPLQCLHADRPEAECRGGASSLVMTVVTLALAQLAITDILALIQGSQFKVTENLADAARIAYSTSQLQSKVDIKVYLGWTNRFSLAYGWCPTRFK